MNEAVVAPRRRRWRAWLWKLPLAFIAFSVLQVLVLRVVDPPFSMFMAARQLDAALAGDFAFRIAHDWRDLDRISPNLPLALVASEDQNFARHNGFDFAAIEKLLHISRETLLARLQLPPELLPGLMSGSAAGRSASPNRLA